MVSIMLYPCIVCVALLIDMFFLCVACLKVSLNSLVELFAICLGVVVECYGGVEIGWRCPVG